MKYLLDTNAVSALMKRDPQVINRLRTASARSIAVPQPVLGEILYGLERLPPSKKRSVLRERLELIRVEFSRADWTDTVSEVFASIKVVLEKKDQRIEDFDVAIAAHAVAVGAVLVTADLDHMTRIPGLKVEDWSRP